MSFLHYEEKKGERESRGTSSVFAIWASHMWGPYSDGKERNLGLFNGGSDLLNLPFLPEEGSGRESTSGLQTFPQGKKKGGRGWILFLPGVFITKQKKKKKGSSQCHTKKEGVH